MSSVRTPRPYSAASPIAHAGLPGDERLPGWGTRVTKRVFDIFFALLLLAPLSLVIVGVALLLKLRQGGAVFYIAPRMKTPTRSFGQLKFRTMTEVANDSGVTGADKKWRITPMGHFLRRTRIDELPQLFNILLGDMSFVGPRPPLREYVELFPREYAQVLRSRPGVTGLATVIYHVHEGRVLRDCKTAEETHDVYNRRCQPMKLRLDMMYQRNWSLCLDFWILWNTVMTVVIPGWRRRRWFGRKGYPRR